MHALLDVINAGYNLQRLLRGRLCGSDLRVPDGKDEKGSHLVTTVVAAVCTNIDRFYRKEKRKCGGFTIALWMWDCQLRSMASRRCSGIAKNGGSLRFATRTPVLCSRGPADQLSQDLCVNRRSGDADWSITASGLWHERYYPSGDNIRTPRMSNILNSIFIWRR